MRNGWKGIMAEMKNESVGGDMLLNKKELKKIFRQEKKQVSKDVLALLERWAYARLIRLIRSCPFRRFTKDDVLI